MKFWELTAAFREYQEALRAVLASPRWTDPYGNWFDSMETIVAMQNREILDRPVPLELSRELCQRCDAVFVLWPDETTLRRYQKGATGFSDQVCLRKFSAVEVHERFGPAVIEEISEYSSATVAGENQGEPNKGPERNAGATSISTTEPLPGVAHP